ncbi:MAG: amidohydrolase family protein [Bacteroidota bacterium]
MMSTAISGIRKMGATRLCFLSIFLLNTVMNGSRAQGIQGIHFANDQAVTIALEGDKIKSINEIPQVAVDQYVAPGLIDIQINGYVGVDFSGPDLTVEGVKKATKALWKAGVTSYLPTIITSDINRIKENFAVLAEARKDPEIGQSIPGFHLEGPYISPVKGFRGAHLAKYIKAPDWEEFEEIQAAAENGIRIITVAPEINGAIELIERCVARGIVVSLGHHNGTAEDIQKAVAAGATMATHLGNGCANEINRHYNPIWPQLSHDEITPSIIADGFHLTRDEVRSFYKVKGPEKTVLVSDALDLAGLPPGEYIRGERRLVLTPNVVKLPDEDVLAGAASPISLCLGVMMRYTDCGLPNAIQMASTNPARILDLPGLGGLDPGQRADMILFRMVNEEVIIDQTYVAGTLVYSRD